MSAAVVELLRAGRGLVAKSWTQGTYARAADGASVPVHHEDAACWCAMGAVYEVASGSCAKAANLAISGLADAIPDGFGGDVAIFNDDPATTQTAIVALFDRAIAAAEAQS